MFLMADIRATGLNGDEFARRLLDPTPLSPEENDESFACFGTEDFQIGYKAFLNKTKPRFTGR